MIVKFRERPDAPGVYEWLRGDKVIAVVQVTREGVRFSNEFKTTIDINYVATTDEELVINENIIIGTRGSKLTICGVSPE